ncbi:hypothetical protein Clacol_009879 [Clathrus columnatus]|uniref:FAS1 domain-containing protein n=1 Tax=Clathrus columnatus TaxID=1419009 RepID=A0AAV5ALS6_9AGAM|nr:hypothetical protein Clacol_009879 [Clathrus columnatus]
MHISLLLVLPFLCHAQTTSPVQNSTQASSLAALSQFLATSGETAFVNATERVIGTTVGNQFVSEIENAATGNGSFTFFVPNNNAFTGSPPKNITDLNTLAGIFTYHLIEGKFTTDNIASSPGYTLVRTFMNTSQLVQLEGNKSQVLALTNDNGTIKIIGQNTPVQVVSTISLPSNATNPNLKAYVLSAVLDPPPTLSDALFSTNLSAFETAARQTSYIDSLESAHGITIFAPSNQAATQFFANNSSFNISMIAALLGNHVINGSTLYSTQFPFNTTSASGEPLTLSTNSSGAFISSGASTAKIIQPDILTSNGVIHVIDTVLLNTAENQTAANSAFSSASSAAATAAAAEATQTSPVGSSGSSSGPSGSNSTSGGNNKTNHAINPSISLGCAISSLLSLIATWAIVL